MIVPAPTGLGWKGIAFYVTLFGAYFAAPYSNLFFLLIAFLSVLGLVNTWWTWSNLRGVTGEVTAFEAVPAGAGQPFHAHLNGGKRAHFQIRCVVDIAGHGLVAAEAPLLRGETRVEGDLPALPRGLYRVRAAWIETSYPLGLLRVKRRAAAPAELVVYPAPADLPEARSSGDLVASLSGMLGGAEGSQQPAGLREYQQGDEMRSIHWRATARRNRLVVKEWEGDAAQGIEVVLDRRAEAEALEQALSLASALALAARENKERMTIHSQGLSMTFGAEHAPWDHLFKFLAGCEALPASDPGPPPAAPSVLRLPLRPREVPA